MARLTDREIPESLGWVLPVCGIGADSARCRLLRRVQYRAGYPLMPVRVIH